MDKKMADMMISKFQKTFFGFALSKTSSIQEAEELAARIVLESYAALLKGGNVANWEGYLYKIACNVYARYVNEKGKFQVTSIDGMDIPMDYDFTILIEQSHDFKKLRTELSYLGMLQRKIVVMHYYDHLKVKDIAKQLDLPVGTIKWHLHDARQQLKKGMEKMRHIGNLGINPVSFSSMGHDGNPGRLGDTAYFLNSKLKQNIAYSAYHEPKTLEEIAEELGVSPVFLEDEVSYLEEYGFMDKLSSGKYRTNIFISEANKDIEEEIYKIDQEIAAAYCKEYIPILIEALRNYKDKEIYVPEDDFNLLLWSAIPYVCGYKHFDWDTYNKILEGTNYRVKRKDGGDYIAAASVFVDFEMEYKKTLEKDHYYVCGNMTRMSSKYPILSWQLSTTFDVRQKGWEDNLNSDYEVLYQFMKEQLPKETAHIESYQRLYDRGLISNKNNKDMVNVIIIKENMSSGRVQAGNNAFLNSMPDYPERLIEIGKELSEKMYQLEKPLYPAHMHRLLQAYSLDCYSNRVKIMIIDELLRTKVLRMPSEDQRKGIMTIVFTDMLP